MCNNDNERARMWSVKIIRKWAIAWETVFFVDYDGSSNQWIVGLAYVHHFFVCVYLIIKL